MSRAQELVRLLGTHEGAALRLGGIDAETLASRHGTPLFVYDAGIVRGTTRRTKDALGPRIELLYSIKANPCVALAATLARAGLGAETASAGEILTARTAGFDASAITIAGPAKSDQDLRAALDSQAIVHLESQAEYERLLALADGRRPRVCVRVSPERPPAGARMRMSGPGAAKFGVSEHEVPSFLTRIVRDGRADLLGLHVYLGTQWFDASAWVEGARWFVAFSNEAEAACGAELGRLEFGGGFGISYADGEPCFDLSVAAAGLRRLVDSDARPGRVYTVELGRHLVAEAGAYLCRVVEVKRREDAIVAIVDGGLNHLAAACGSGSVLKRPFPVVDARDPLREGVSNVRIAGPLCTPADALSGEHRLPEPRPGALLAVLAAGAYGPSFSPASFLGRPSAAEVVVEDGQCFVARPQGRPEDALRGQAWPRNEAA